MPSSCLVTGPTLNILPDGSCTAARRSACLTASDHIDCLSNCIARKRFRPAFLLYFSGFLVCQMISPQPKYSPHDSRLTMRRRIVALSALCFFSSALRFLFSRLAATLYSLARCLRSHSSPVTPLSAPFTFQKRASKLTFPWCNFVHTWDILSPPPIFLLFRIDDGEALATGDFIRFAIPRNENSSIGARGGPGIPAHGD